MNATLLRGALIGAVVGSSIAIGQPASTQSPLNPPANGPKHADPGWHYLSNATVHSRPGETIEHASVLIRDGRIEGILPAHDAKPADAPAGAKVWDCTGLHIYPGFIDAFVEVEAPKPDLGQPGAHWNTRVTPQRSALDGTGVDSATAESLRKLGFTAAGISPSGGIFRGKGAVVSLAKPASELSVDRPPVYSRNAYHVVSFELGRGFGRRAAQTPTPGTPGLPGAGQPQETGERWSGYPDSEMGAIALIRQTFLDQEWQEQARKAGSQVAFNSLDALDPEWARNAPDNTVAALPVGNRNGQEPMPVLFDTEDELEALRAGKIAREFKRPAILVGSGSEYKRLDAIKADGLPIILPLRYPRTPDVGTMTKAESADLESLMAWEQAPTNPRRLEAAGVKFALTTAKLRNRSEFSANLSQALKHGLAPEAAMAAVTTRPAEMLGVADKLGTIEKGRIANLVVADGDMFEAWPKPKASEATPEGDAKGDDAAKPEAAADPGDDEDDTRTAGLQPQGRQRGGRGGFGGGLGAPGGGPGGGTRAVGAKVREVWIDGERQEINPAPATKLTGTWEAKLDPAPEGAAKLTVDGNNAVTVWLGDKSVRAGSFTLTENRITFQVDDGALGLKGTSLVSGVVEGEDMHGTGIDAEGKAFTWSAHRTSKEAPRDPAAGRRGAGFRQRGDAPPRENGDPASTPQPEEKDRAPAAEARESLKAEQSEQLKKLLQDPADAKHGQPPAEGEAKKDAPAEGEPRRDRPQGAGERPPPRKPAEQEEKDAIAAIPEKLGYPFGPYMLDAMPAQETVLVTNATIWTEGPKGLIDKGWMLVEGGKIKAIGSGSAPQANGARVVDATGKHISPGIIDCHSHTGISRGVNEGGQAVTAEVRIQDVTDPDSVAWYRELAGGTTTVNNLHGSANAIGGQNCINKIRWGVVRPDDMHFEGAMPGIKFALGENPRQVNGGGGGGRFGNESARYPASRMGVETLIRDRFTAAKEYAEQWKKSETAKQRSGDKGSMADSLPPRRDLELEALAEVLEGKRLVHCHSYRQDELLMLCRIADEFHFKIGTFQHVLEGYKVADEIAKHSLGGSCFSDWWAYKVEVQDAIPQDGPIMAEQGVVVSYNSDSDELARRLNVEAGKAVKYGGLKPEEALKFVTINPAKQLMIDKQVGSLEVGKDADFVIWSAAPTSSLSRCEATYVDGRRLFSIEDDAKLRERITGERSRLIQKVLAAAKNGRGGGGGGPPGAGGEPRGEGRPTDDTGRGGMLQRYYKDLIERGYDPESNRPGECGCYQ